MSARQPRPAASFAARSKRWTSSAARPEPKSSQNAQGNSERYLALARAEAQIGNTVGAENYYQYAEHYFRSMRSDSEGGKRLCCDGRLRSVRGCIAGDRAAPVFASYRALCSHKREARDFFCQN